MKSYNNINNFNDYWTLYLQDHDTRVSRAFHYVGTALALAATVLLIRAGMLFFLPLALVPAYLAAAVGHRLGLRGADATNRAPIWAILADFRMFILFLTGRLGPELRRASQAA